MESPTAAIPPSPPVARLGPLLRAFLFDAFMAFVLVTASGVATMAAWMVWQAAILARHGQGAAEIEAVLHGQPGPLGQVLVVVATSACAALVLYAWRRRADANERAASLAAIRRRSTWGWIVLVALAVFAGSSLLGALGTWLGIESVPSNLVLVDAMSAQWPFTLVLFAVVLAPAYEELLFRRVFFGRFLAAGRPWLGVVVSSLAFALLHEVPGVSANPPLAMLQLWLIYGGMGAAFAWLYWRTGTLWAPFLAHALNNSLALAFHSQT